MTMRDALDLPTDQWSSSTDRTDAEPPEQPESEAPVSEPLPEIRASGEPEDAPHGKRRGRPPGLKHLLTKEFPDGATLEQLRAVCYTGDPLQEVYCDGRTVTLNEQTGIYYLVRPRRGRPPGSKTLRAESSARVVTYPASHEFQFHELCRDPPIVGDEFEAFCADIRERGQLEPVTLHADGTVLDGRNKVLAGKKLQIGVKAVTYQGDDPKAFVASVNFHRRHLTIDQKRDRAATILRDNPHMSDSAVASIAGISDKTVANVRSRSEIPSASTRTDTKGRRQPAKKPRRQVTKEDVQNAALGLFHQAAAGARDFAGTKPTLVPTDDPKVIPWDGSKGDALLTAALADPEPTEPTAEVSAVPAEAKKPLLELIGRSPEDFAVATQAIGGLRWFQETAKNMSPEFVARAASPSELSIIRRLCEEALAWIVNLYARASPSLSGRQIVSVVKRLIKDLPTDELEDFKHWFREYTGCALEAATPKRSRGRPRKDGTPAQPRKPKDPPAEAAEPPAPPSETAQ